jgi:ComF family protein
VRYCITCKSHLGLKNHCLCDDCISALPWLTAQCPRCALPLTSHSKNLRTICPECQQKAPPFRRCVAAFQYQEPINKLVTAIKTNHHAPELVQLSRLLATTIMDYYEDNQLPQIMIPVPLHWRKLTRRGFNQSYGIALMLSQHLPDIQLRNDICYRQSHSAPQHLHGKRQRLNFMRNAFTTNNRIDGQSVAIVDDVVTTKATAIAAASSLIMAGAKHVDIWCIARTGWHIDSP